MTWKIKCLNLVQRLFCFLPGKLNQNSTGCILLPFVFYVAVNAVFFSQTVLRNFAFPNFLSVVKPSWQSTL